MIIPDSTCQQLDLARGKYSIEEILGDRIGLSISYKSHPEAERFPVGEVMSRYPENMLGRKGVCLGN